MPSSGVEGIHISAISNSINNFVIDSNVIVANAGRAIWLEADESNSSGGIIRNNLLYGDGVGTAGMYLSASGGCSASVAIYNNTINNFATYGLYVDEGPLYQGNTMSFTAENNIITNSGTCYTYPNPGHGTATVNNNLSSDGTADDNGGTGHLTGKSAANQFINTSTDFHLKGTADALNAGKTEASFDWDALHVDADNWRPQGSAWDMGALEHAAPNAPVLVSPSDGTTINDDTPTLSANYSDPDAGDTGTTNYRIATSAANCLVGTVLASGTSLETASNNQNTTWTPGSSIGNDVTYYWCAQNNDGALTSAWTSMGNFILDTIPPSVPGIPQATIGSNLTSQDWSWTASTDANSGMSHYDWRVDSVPSGETYTGTTTTPTVSTNLATGTWKFYVKAEDNAGNQSAENSSLLAVLSSSIHEVVLDSCPPLPLIQVVTPNSVSNPVIDLSPITVLNEGLWEANIDCEIFLKTLLSSTTITVDIPAGTVIKGASSVWTDKVLIPPTSTTATLLPAGSSVVLAIKIGHDVAPLNIYTKGVRIFLEGQGGKKVGYISNNVFAEITNTCATDSQTVGDALTTGQDCKIDSGSDLVIWTKHFTEFVTYDLVPSLTNTSSNNSSSNSSSSSSSSPGCGNSITNGKPDLFEIMINDKTATLYFAPPTMPYDSFYIAYSRKPDSLEYGTEFSQSYSGGVIKKSINMLQLNTVYYFKIRAGNGCATGSWGNTMTAKTTSLADQNRTFYKNVFTAFWQNVTKNQGTLRAEPVHPNPTPKSKPAVAIPTVGTQTPKPIPAQNKFCILWWCF